jgi:hypothetical protein
MSDIDMEGLKISTFGPKSGALPVDVGPPHAGVTVQLGVHPTGLPLLEVVPVVLLDDPPPPPLPDPPPAPVLEDEADPPVPPLPELVLPLLLEDAASVPLDIAFTEHPDAAAAAVRRRERKD